MIGTQSFDILDISQSASFEEAKKAYKQLVKKWHPDQFADQPEMQTVAQEKLKEINVAYREVFQILKVRSREEKEGISPPHEALRHRERKVSEESAVSWQPFIARCIKKFGDAIQFLWGKNATQSRRLYKSNESKDTGLKDRSDGKSASLKFEEVLQKSLQKRSGVSRSVQQKKEPGTRKQNSKGQITTPTSGAYRIRSRSKRSNKGCIEAIRPIEKIKGIGKIR